MIDRVIKVVLCLGPQWMQILPPQGPVQTMEGYCRHWTSLFDDRVLGVDQARIFCSYQGGVVERRGGYRDNKEINEEDDGNVYRRCYFEHPWREMEKRANQQRQLRKIRVNMEVEMAVG